MLVQQLSPYSFWVLENTFSLSHFKFMGSNSSSLLLTPDTALTPADFYKPCSFLVSGIFTNFPQLPSWST